MAGGSSQGEHPGGAVGEKRNGRGRGRGSSSAPQDRTASRRSSRKPSPRRPVIVTGPPARVGEPSWSVWSEEEVGVWAAGYGYNLDYRKAFVSKQVDGQLLVDVADEELGPAILTELGVTQVDQTRMQADLVALKPAPPTKTLFLGNLPKGLPADALVEAIKGMMLVKGVNNFTSVRTNTVTKARNGPKVMAWVEFTTKEEADVALGKLEGATLPTPAGGEANVEIVVYTSRKRRAVPCRTLRVTRLLQWTNKAVSRTDMAAILRRHFERMGGRVTEVFLPKDRRPFSFIMFEELRDAVSATEKLHGVAMGSDVLGVTCLEAEQDLNKRIELHKTAHTVAATDQLVQEILGMETPEHVLAFHHDYLTAKDGREQLSNPQLVALFRRLQKMGGSKYLISRVNGELTIRDDRFAAMVQNTGERFQANAESLDSRTATSLLHAYASLGVSPASAAGLVNVVDDEAGRLAESANTLELSNIVFALAKMGVKADEVAPNIFAAVEGQSDRLVEASKVQTLALAVWAFVTAGVEAPRLMGGVEAHADRIAEEGDVWVLAMLMGAYAKSVPDRLMNSQGRWAEPPPDVAPKLFAAVEKQAERLVEEGGPRNIALILSAYAHLHKPAPALFQAVEDQCEGLTQTASSQSLANLVWSYARLYSTGAAVPSPRVLAAVAEESERLVEEGSPQEVAMALWAYANSQVDNPALYDKVEEQSERLVAESDGRVASMFVRQHAKVGKAAPRLFAAVEAHADRIMADANVESLAKTVWAFTMMGVEAPRLYEAVEKQSERIATKFKSLSDVAMARWAYQSADVEAPMLMEALAPLKIQLDELIEIHGSPETWIKS